LGLTKYNSTSEIAHKQTRQEIESVFGLAPPLPSFPRKNTCELGNPLFNINNSRFITVGSSSIIVDSIMVESITGSIF